MTTKESSFFADIKQGLEEAIDFDKGKPTGASIIIPRTVDIKAIRSDLGMTQEQFSQRFDIPLGTLRKWERNERIPDRMACAFLKVLQHSPQTVMDALR